MSGPGTLWSVPGDRQALEVSGSTRDYLRLAVIDPQWPFPRPPIEVARTLCRRLPSRYLGGQVDSGDFEEALL